MMFYEPKKEEIKSKRNKIRPSITVRVHAMLDSAGYNLLGGADV